MSRTAAILSFCIGVVVLAVAGWSYWEYKTGTNTDSVTPTAVSANGPDSVTYDFVSPLETGPISEHDNKVSVSPLEEGEWVVIFSSGYTTLKPLGNELGTGDKCYVLGIKGPTSGTYEVEYAAVDASHVSEDTEEPYRDFEQNMYDITEFLRGYRNCEDGVEVLVISK